MSSPEHNPASSIQRAAVLGAGTMGHGIAHVLSASGIETRLFDISEDAVETGRAKVAANLEKGVARGKVTEEERDAALAHLTGTSDMDAAIDGVDIVIEAVPERMDLKTQIFGALGSKLGSDVVLATNTSSLSIREIAEAAEASERVVGMHFFNPVHIMKLVEVVRTAHTSDAAAELALGLARRMGKDPIDVRDAPGFASSRLGIAIGMEAIRMVEEKVASAEDIDKAMTLGYGFPMGPLKLTDLVGLDVRLAIAEYLKVELGERFDPPQLLRDMVERGDLGKKSGQGFYSWEGDARG
ncbi:3-hydroxybutyryl-CoA dehydrogenase [Planctomycetes bacterium Poly30]|uniref:3-hydroxybutyryl-CoA dehydrogenase n=1 Tax=Saltatorellus ferox TaxID=2528018 RepID=A0A518EXN8_9BACT|nr:3-hydroxybutyryl-CoA dehydrogenase [Planctomycetes bacterium Poly30]